MSAERPACRELDGSGQSIAIVCSRFNEEITTELLCGAQRTLREHGVAEDAIEVFSVPGAFELPLIAKRLCASLGALGQCELG